ncbi:hypothetical protein U9M48_038456 [Paspalum notatum var. saurae]|uniref:GAG-pre-integrase domain-containing protein n=1 Tax=Paspalum notatum var. saurae TaxID=547442 RepID=A0AAQ3UHL9_PASNO
MEPIIREQVETLPTVSEVWSVLERQFAGKSNKMQATRIMRELTHLKQGSRSMVKYAGEELGTGRILGTGTMHNGLYYLDEGSDEIAFATKIPPCQELLLLRRRLGHPSFAIMSCNYPSLFSACPRESLICDACEFAKHTRVSYPSLGLRSNKPFDVIHSDVLGPCENIETIMYEYPGIDPQSPGPITPSSTLDKEHIWRERIRLPCLCMDPAARPRRREQIILTVANIQNLPKRKFCQKR